MAQIEEMILPIIEIPLHQWGNYALLVRYDVCRY